MALFAKNRGIQKNFLSDSLIENVKKILYPLTQLVFVLFLLHETETCSGVSKKKKRVFEPI